VFGQVQRASLSVQLNIAEGWSFGPSPTCTRHLSIAFGSAVETIELIEHLMVEEIVSKPAGEELLRRATRCRSLLVGLLKQRRPFN
jgi:four helix bundle protein